MDVDALLACLAESEPVDPLWLDVEAGRRYTQETAIRRYPQLKTSSFEDLGFVMARKRKVANRKPQDLKTYLAEDVDALAARLAAPEPETVDPLWLEVEAGRRYSQATAMQRYPQLNLESFKDKSLAFQMARKPKIGSCSVSRSAGAGTGRSRAWLRSNEPRASKVQYFKKWITRIFFPELNLGGQ